MKERRQSILDAAEVIFAKNGYHDTSMAEIARTAEFGVGYLYRHFTDKGDLYLAVIERKTEAFLSTVRAAFLHEGPAKATLATLARVYLSFFESNRIFFKLNVEQAANCPPELQREHRTRVFSKIALIHAEVGNLIQRGITQGELRPLPTESTASLFLGMLHGLVGRWFMLGAEGSLSQDAETAIDIFFRGIAS
jgi:AcrR family transcriptional regulator